MDQYTPHLQDFLLEMQDPPKVTPHYADFYTFFDTNNKQDGLGRPGVRRAHLRPGGRKV